jgi:hypothetical protein
MRLALSLRRALLAASLAVAACADAAGLPAPDRIDFLESPAVIGLGQWQFDPAFPTLRAIDGNTATRTTPPEALRLGTRMEFRAAATGPADTLAMESATDRVRRLHGFSDVSLGARWRVHGGDAGWMPGVAWLADVEATMGSPATRGRDFRPSLRATAEWALPRQMTIAVMPGLYRDRGDDGRHYAAGVLAVTLGKAWTPRLQSFVELAGQRQSREQADGSLLDIDTGLAFVATRTLQLDLVVSHSLAGNVSQATRGGLSVSSRF